jgi:hypothetical protein
MAKQAVQVNFNGGMGFLTAIFAYLCDLCVKYFS